MDVDRKILCGFSGWLGDSAEFSGLRDDSIIMLDALGADLSMTTESGRRLLLQLNFVVSNWRRKV